MRFNPLVAACLLSFAALAQQVSAETLAFDTHAAFFSKELGLPDVLDPQVFVLDPQQPAGRHWQNVEHVAGVRNARADDPVDTPVYNAQRKPLGMTVGEWLHGNGSATVEPLADGREAVVVVLHGLKPGGRFSLFENHFDQNPVGFTPLDGTAAANSLLADANGDATVALIAPQTMTHANAILVVFHSDGVAHGNQRGDIGIDAHHQLIARLP